MHGEEGWRVWFLEEKYVRNWARTVSVDHSSGGCCLSEDNVVLVPEEEEVAEKRREVVAVMTRLVKGMPRRVVGSVKASVVVRIMER